MNRQPMGARPTAEGVEFRVWAPRCRTVAVKIVSGPAAPNTLVMRRAGTRPCRAGTRPGREGDIFEALVAGAGPGSEYFYVIDDERERPDPVSRRQPRGVHGPSCVVDASAFRWTDAAWKGLPLADYVIYKLHVGTFSATSDFAGVAARLSCLKELGVTAIELMPVSSFPGTRNWGYDGVHHYAPQESYGGPEALRALIDAAHALGLAVVMDVVYNHLGPEGNYLSEFGPYFTDRYQTPWGWALNYDGPESDFVRNYSIGNALHWLTEYHIDGLRLDAVHAIHDEGALHILEELADRFHSASARLGRKAYLIAESDLNDPRIIRPETCGGYGLDAQWHDEFHHAVHAIVARSTEGYFADYGRLGDLAKAMREGFVLDGGYSHYRHRRFGRSSADRPGYQFVVFTQNHDQIANASQGCRIAARLSRAEDALSTALLFFAPGLPLLFMGQEYGETAPFHYFISHTDPELCRLVTDGRRKEYEAHGDRMNFFPPEDPATFAASRLQWTRREAPGHAGTLLLYRDLIDLRKRHAALNNGRKDLLDACYDETARWLLFRRADPSGAAVLAGINFSDRPVSVPIPVSMRGIWRLIFSSSSPCYGLTPADEQTAPALSEMEITLLPKTAVLYAREVSA